MVVIVSGYTLFVMTQYDVILCKPTFWRSLLTQHAYAETQEQR